MIISTLLLKISGTFSTEKFIGIGHFIVGDKEGGVQALKDSVKIGAVAVTVIGGAVGGMVITSGDGKFNAKERADAAKGIGQIVSDIWNW
ncbi:hypothetical protein GCK72_025927 [Caenorhabditis remanei]|uniref:Uncharacterized protein n=1 Tax=Caenorhabditis remanei TaxID=31234 RepID=A0A6A5G4P4_CAERE|nr:hypothetical protein GCK72_025927 [Caenorhabditis remanei]KAF1749459.1 hypothetical protein GCK72_025927 [Caenorhabditis remanei]